MDIFKRKGAKGPTTEDRWGHEEKSNIKNKFIILDRKQENNCGSDNDR